MANRISRRDVLRGTAAAAVGLAIGKVEAASPSGSVRSGVVDSRLRVGVIGSGGKGWSGMEWAAQYGDIIAICDIDAKERSRAMMEYTRAHAFTDYREMLDALHGKLDAVIVSTPDHHHYPASMLAMKQGLHCYCEKPLTRTIWEARQMGRIARDKKVATQMGNQSTASTPMRKAAALVKSGAFGAVKEIHLWTDRAARYWQQGIPRPKAAVAPKHVDFDLWLGPRPDRPYGEGYHPFSWRGWWDFGTGALGDMGCHIFNMSHMAMHLVDPISVKAETSGHDRDSFPTWAIVHYEFAARGARPPFTLHWYDGGKKPDASLAQGFELGGNGSIVVCENATVYSPDEGNTQFMLVGGAPMPTVEVDESPGHMAEFFRAAEGGKPARSNFPGYASPMTETVLLGNLAIWADGPRLEWDARKMRVKGTSEFDALIKPEFRKGYGV